MVTFVARQPILDKKLGIYGYELLFRAQSTSVAFDAIEGNFASSEIITNAFHELGIAEVTGGKRAFVNFTETLLLSGIATILPSSVLVVELLENILPTPEVLEACKKLRKRGFKIALDDFILTPEYSALLSVADIIKIDFMSTPMDKIELFARSLADSRTTLLAEKIETQEMYEEAVRMGFSLFQGYFFAKPVIVDPSRQRLNPMKINCLRLIRAANDEDFDFRRIANIIKNDVALSYRLLRVLNSAFFGLHYTVKNINQALAILGMVEVKKWVTLVSLNEMSSNKPVELMRMALLRAKFLETLAPHMGIPRSADDLFMLGLVSLMDTMMDTAMLDLIEQTNLAENIARPLLTGEGRFAELLRMVIHYERSEWDQMLSMAETLHIEPKTLSDIYLEVARWADSM